MVFPSGVYHHYPQRNPSLKSSAGPSSNFSKVSLPQSNLPVGRQGFIFLRRNYIHKHFTFSYILFTYMIKCILTLSHVEQHGIMHIIHHDIAYNLCFCLFKKKDNPKDNYLQLSQFQIRYLYLARAYLRVIISRLDSCI